ncbi:MAG: PQQ-binding-like beta-propeller repeat protein, partial [bacterium]|nr:PQQ-binding-like beta-propeller repeat protein [bacterium]
VLLRGGSNPPSLFGLIGAYKKIRVTYYETLDQSNGMMTFLVKNTQPNHQVKAPKWGKYDHTKYEAENNTGEGLVRFDPKTGKIVWRHYFDYLMDFNEVFNRIGAAGGDMGGTLEGAAQMINAARARKYTDSYLTQPIVNNGKVYLCADRKMLCFDNVTGNVEWETPEIGNATGLVELDNTFYIQIGRTFKSYKYTLSTSPGSCKAKETKIETKKPFGFLAIDKAKGNIVWDMTKEKEFKEDPTSYLMEYNAERKTMYCSDGKFIFAIPFTRDGKISWKHTLKELGVGSVKPEDGVVFIVKSRSSSSSSYYSGNGFGYTITTTVEYDVRKVLGVEYRKDKQGREFILGIGEDGLVRIDLDGKVVWKADKKVWDWDRDDVTFTPFYLPDGDICFGFNRRLTRIDVDKGSTIFQVKEDKTASFDVHPTGNSLIAYTKKWIRSFDLTQAE